MKGKAYSIEVKEEAKLVEVTFASNLNYTLMEEALSELREFVKHGYRIKLISYLDRESNYIRAFKLALSLLGKEDIVVLENKARFSRADRRKSRSIMRELRRQGQSAREISRQLNVPLKTIYRWLSQES